MTDSNCLALRIWAFACSRNPLNRLLVRQNILQPMRYTFYLRDKDCTDFMASVSVTWDETKVLTAAVGEYLVVAKRTGLSEVLLQKKDRRLKSASIFLKLTVLMR